MMSTVNLNITPEIQEDFQHDLAVGSFPFLEQIRASIPYQNALLTEFSELTSEPKLHLYFRSIIPDEIWAKNCMENKGPVYSSSDRQGYAANFIAPTEIDNQASEVIANFEKLNRDKNVPAEFYGRLLEKTETVKLFRKVDSDLDLFRKYVIHNKTVGVYQDFARTAMKKLVRLLQKIKIPGLRLELVQYFLDISANDDFRMFLYFQNAEGAEATDLIEKFSILKTFANEVIHTEYFRFPLEIQNAAASNTSNPITADNATNSFALKNQFKDHLKYQQCFDKLITSGIIHFHSASDKLMLIPIRKGRLNEGVTIFEVMNELGFLKKSTYSTLETKQILTNTF